jgi:acyl-CoA hydrolase
MLVDPFLELIKAGVIKREVEGALVHGAFFLGPRSFYRALREMNDVDRSRLQMKAVSFTNEIYDDIEMKRRSRVGARFINSAMMVTLLGAVVSDALDDGRVVSGVGGQYNFASQAFALDGARFVVTLESTRTSEGRVVSNIRWSYGHDTLPRHLRDIVVTEYGVADLRGKSDRDVIAAMLAISDSRFQAKLLQQARHAGKIEETFQIPPAHRANTPDRIQRALGPTQAGDLLPSYPFGTDFTETEQRLLPALDFLKSCSRSPLHLLGLLIRGLSAREMSAEDAECLSRMNLAAPRSVPDYLYCYLLSGVLRRSRQ